MSCNLLFLLCTLRFELWTGFYGMYSGSRPKSLRAKRMPPILRGKSATAVCFAVVAENENGERLAIRFRRFRRFSAQQLAKWVNYRLQHRHKNIFCFYSIL